MTYCRVRNCRFPYSHTTHDHKCGICRRTGHGQIECNNPGMKETLTQYFSEILPSDKWCSICHSKHHTTEAHHCETCGQRNCNSGVFNNDCIIQPIDYYIKDDTYYNSIQPGDIDRYSVDVLYYFIQQEFIDFTRDYIENTQSRLDHDGVFCSINIGMGHMIYLTCRRRETELGGYIISTIYIDNSRWGQYEGVMNDSPLYHTFVNNCFQVSSDQFIHIPIIDPVDNSLDPVDNSLDPVDNSLDPVDNSYPSAPIYAMGAIIISPGNRNIIPQSNLIKCPECRTPNDRSKCKAIFGIDKPCSICYDNNIEFFLPECGHANVCRVCLDKL